MTKPTTESRERPWTEQRLAIVETPLVAVRPGTYPERLLEYLRASAGQVVTREELARDVWNLRLDHRSRVIDQTISVARKSLHANERITAVQGRGYRFGVPRTDTL